MGPHHSKEPTDECPPRKRHVLWEAAVLQVGTRGPGSGDGAAETALGEGRRGLGCGNVLPLRVLQRRGTRASCRCGTSPCGAVRLSSRCPRRLHVLRSRAPAWVLPSPWQPGSASLCVQLHVTAPQHACLSVESITQDRNKKLLLNRDPMLTHRVVSQRRGLRVGLQQSDPRTRRSGRSPGQRGWAVLQRRSAHTRSRAMPTAWREVRWDGRVKAAST